MKTIQLGEVRIDRVVESEGPLFDAGFIFPDASTEAVDRERDWLEPNFIDPATGKLIMSFHSYLVRTPRHTILVDACVGNDKERPHRAFWHRLAKPYLADLARLGVAPADIDYVMCTHMHIDHVGWNTRLASGRWVPTFPNAKYLFAREEFEHWNRLHASGPAEPVNHGSFEDSVLPVVAAGQAVFVESDHRVDACCGIEAAPGHSPGNIMVRLESNRACAVLCGDTIQHALQIAYPGWSSRFCHDPALAARTRTHLVESLADSDTLLLAAHFPEPVAGRVIRRGERYRFQF